MSTRQCFSRHGTFARSARAHLYGALVGGTAWPPRFSRARAKGGLSEAADALYVHIPFCRSLCPHCPYQKVRYDAELARRYAETVQHELEVWDATAPLGPLRHVYFGGGTPALLLAELPSLLETIRRRRTTVTGVGIELHPLDCSPHTLAQLRQLGFDRVSIGVETLQAQVLTKLGRSYSPEQAVQAVAYATRASFSCVDVNLLYGIDGQTEEGVLRDVLRLIELGVHQISAYPLIAFGHTRTGSPRGLRQFLSRDRLQRRIRKTCEQQGLVPTSVWSFTKPGAPTYSTVTLPNFRGFGAGAATKSLRGFWFHTFDPKRYIETQARELVLGLEGDEAFFRAHWLYWKIYQLQVSESEYRALFKSELNCDFALLLRTLCLLGLLRAHDDGWRVTPWGADWVHRLQQLYSLSFIDQFWESCRREAWPETVVLE